MAVNALFYHFAFSLVFSGFSLAGLCASLMCGLAQLMQACVTTILPHETQRVIYFYS